MARVKLTEHKAKSLLFKELNQPYSGVSASLTNIPSLPKEKEYVVKVDQGVKKRMKRGLVKLRVKKEKIKESIIQLQKKGYDQFIIEEFVPHESSEERYLAMEQGREGIIITYSKKGGIDVEENTHEVRKFVIPFSHPELVSGSLVQKMLKQVQHDMMSIEQELHLPTGFLAQLREFFEKYYFSFIEINPLVVKNHPVPQKAGHPSFVRRGAKTLLLDKEESPKGEVVDSEIFILDLAAEVDSTAEFLVKGVWTEADIVGEQHKTLEEETVAKLNKKSQAALSLTILNPEGSIWVLLSGGGASITVADEVYNLGFGKELGNYGEYSGNPNAEETYLYTKAILEAMTKNSRRRLMLIGGGGVANFTDIRITFKGVIKALEEYKEKLKKKEIKIFFRRGGPHQEEGLRTVEEFAKREGMYGLVRGPDLPLHEIVRAAVKELQK